MKARYVIPILFFTNAVTYSFSQKAPEVIVETKVVKAEPQKLCKHIVEEVVVMQIGSQCEPKKPAKKKEPKVTEHDLKDDIIYELKDPEFNERLIEEIKNTEFSVPNGKVVSHTKTLDKTCKKKDCGREHINIKAPSGDMVSKTIDKGFLERAYMKRDGVVRSVNYNRKTGQITSLEINRPNKERHYMYFHSNGKVNVRYDEFDDYRIRHTFGENGLLQKSVVTKITDHKVVYSNISF